MLTRRVFLASGGGILAVAAAGGALQVLGRLDDAARAVGLDPRRRPDDADEALVAKGLAAEAAVLAGYRALRSGDTALRSHVAAYLPLGERHLAALGAAAGTTTRGTSSPDIAPAPGTLTAQVAALQAQHARLRAAYADDALVAVSPDLAVVLGALSASHAQQHALLSAVQA